MYRTPNLMIAKERELDYLCRLDITDLPTEKPSNVVSKLLVDFILRNKLDLNGQTGKNYVTFREHGADQSFIGGFGSRHQIARLLIHKDFNIKEHNLSQMSQIINLYSKIDFELTIYEECVTYSLKEDYTRLEDVEYVEFVYNLSLATDKGYYPESKLIIRHYFEEAEPSFSMEDREDLDMDLVIIITTSLTHFNEFVPVFIKHHKHSFCSKLGFDVDDFTDDTVTLIQMMDI